jgi:hypothetical protein
VNRPRAWLEEERDAHVLGLLRALIAGLLLLQTGRAWLEFRAGGFFRDYWHMSILPNRLGPPEWLYVALLWLALVASACALLGVWPRRALLLASVTGFYFLLCDRLQYHNNRYALLLIALLTSFLPSDRSFSVLRLGARALPPAERRAPTWARRLVQAQVSLIYAASALGKLADPDWRGGQVLAMRYLKTLYYLRMQGVSVPAWLASIYGSPWFASLTSKGAITLELFLAIGLWLPWTRAFALWLGVLFHLSIELSARVELFSWLMCSAYVAFVTLECRERALEFSRRSRAATALAWLVRRLDLLARFEVRESSEPEAPALLLRDRSGRAHTGAAALAQVARAFPPLFLLWPLLAAAALVWPARKRSANAVSAA